MALAEVWGVLLQNHHKRAPRASLPGPEPGLHRPERPQRRGAITSIQALEGACRGGAGRRRTAASPRPGSLRDGWSLLFIWNIILLLHWQNTTAQSRQGLPRARSKGWGPSGHTALASRSVCLQWGRAHGGGQQGGGEAELESGGKDGPQRWTLWAQLWASRSALKEAPRPQSAAPPPGL